MIAALSAAAFTCIPASAAGTVVSNAPALSLHDDDGTNIIRDTGLAPESGTSVPAEDLWTADTSAAGDASFMAWCLDFDGDRKATSLATAFTPRPRPSTGFYGGSKADAGANFRGPGAYVADSYPSTLQFGALAFKLASDTSFRTDNLSAREETSNHPVAKTGPGRLNLLGLADGWLDAIGARTRGSDGRAPNRRKDAVGSAQNVAYIAPIPMSSSLAMLLSAIGLMVFVARRRRKSRGADY